MQGIMFKPWKQKAIRESPFDRLWQTRRLDHLKEINQEPSSWNFCGNAVRIIPPVKVDDSLFQHADGHCISVRPRYRIGETVYIKEAFALHQTAKELGHPVVFYKERGDIILIINHWRSPMFMPSWAARDFSKIVAIRYERLQDITEDDAKAEGITIIRGTHQAIEKDPGTGELRLVGEPEANTAKYHFAALWDSINPKYPWSSNPWVCVYTFQKVEKEKVK